MLIDNLLNDVGARTERFAHVGALVAEVHAAAVVRVEHEAASGIFDQRWTLGPHRRRHLTVFTFPRHVRRWQTGGRTVLR